MVGDKKKKIVECDEYGNNCTREIPPRPHIYRNIVKTNPIITKEQNDNQKKDTQNISFEDDNIDDNPYSSVFATYIKDKSILEKRFVHKDINFIFRWAVSKHNNFNSDTSQKLRTFLSELVNVGDFKIFNSSELNLHSCSMFKIKYLEYFSRQKIANDLILNNKIYDFDIKSASNLGIDLIKDLINTANKIEANIEDVSQRHELVEIDLIKSNKNVIAVEVPIWDDSLLITGHIDIILLVKYKGKECIFVVDYKPEVLKGKSYNFLTSIPQVCFYGLLLQKKLTSKDIKIYCISFNRERVWIYEPNLIYSLPSILKNYYNNRYFDFPLTDIFGELRIYEYLDWILLLNMYALQDYKINSFFDAIKCQLCKILNLSYDYTLDKIAFSLKDTLDKIAYSFINDDQRINLFKINGSINILFSKNLQNDSIFNEFFNNYYFNQEVWKSFITKENENCLKILLEINKLRYFFIKSIIKKMGLRYYILIILYSLGKGTRKEIKHILINVFNFYNLNDSTFDLNISNLIQLKNLRKDDDSFYYLANHLIDNFKSFNLRKDIDVIFERNKLLLKEHPYAYQILEYLNNYKSFNVLSKDIIENVRLKIRDSHGRPLRLMHLEINLRFLYDHQFLDNNGLLTTQAKEILEELESPIEIEDLDNKKISFFYEILHAIYSLDYPRYSYIKYYLDSLREEKSSNKKLLSRSLNQMLYNNFIYKCNRFYSLNLKIQNIFLERNIKKNEELRLYGNILEFKEIARFAPFILKIIKYFGKINRASIRRSLPSDKSLSGTVSEQSLFNNIEYLINMNYIYENDDKTLQLTIDGESLFENSEFLDLIKNFELPSKIIMDESLISKIPYIDNILQLIFSMEIIKYNTILNVFQSIKISKFFVDRAIEVLLANDYIQSYNRENTYILTAKGIQYLSKKGLAKESDLYIDSIIHYFDSHLKQAPIILNLIFEHNSIYAKKIIEFSNIPQTTFYRAINILCEMKILNKIEEDEYKNQYNYTRYSLTEKGLSLFLNRKFLDFIKTNIS